MALAAVRRTARETVLIASTRTAPRLMSLLPRRVKRLLSGPPMVVDGNTLDATLAAIVAGRRRLGLTGLIADEDVSLSRRLFLAMGQSFGGRPDGIDVADVSIPGPVGAIRLRHYRSSEADAPALMYFHGGAYLLGGPDSYDAVCRMLCRDAGAHVFAPDYRLAPEHVAPAAVDDCLAADLSGLAPALVVTAGFDPLRDEGNAYAAALAAAGVPVDLREAGSMTHGFINFDALGGEVSLAIDEVTAALRTHLSRSGGERTSGH